MKNLAQQTLRTALAVLALAGLCFVLGVSSAWVGIGGVEACLLFVLPLAVVCCVVFRRVRNEDRIASLEAALCREQNARSQADHALAEADLLLARLTTRSRGEAVDPAGQLALIHGEMVQLQRQLNGQDAQLALRTELLCLRIERLASSLRPARYAAESG